MSRLADATIVNYPLNSAAQLLSHGWIDAEGGAPSKTFSSGIMTIDCSSFSSWILYTEPHPMAPPSSTWFDEVDSTLGWAVEASIWLDPLTPGGGAVTLWIHDKTDLLQLYIYKDHVSLTCPPVLGTYNMNTTDGYHTYRVESVGPTATVWIDGVVRIAAPASCGGGATVALVFGDKDGSDGGSVSHWDYFQYTTVTGGPADSDGDGVLDSADNCPVTANPGQQDGDADGVGNACDNCPALANASQADAEADGVGNVCDNCPAVANTNQADPDGDAVGSACDNCPSVANPNQADQNNDGIGDACESDGGTGGTAEGGSGGTGGTAEGGSGVAGGSAGEGGAGAVGPTGGSGPAGGQAPGGSTAEPLEPGTVETAGCGCWAQGTNSAALAAVLVLPPAIGFGLRRRRRG